MTFLPIVERELRIAARLSATYRNRSLAAGAVMLVALVALPFSIIARSPSTRGASMFRILSFLAMLYCVLEGVRKTADCLSEEKREGTLGLLFLTDLKGYDVVLGKLAATSLSSIYGLFAILPVLAMPILVGGVLPAEYWRMALALANILFFSLCAGLLVSALCRREREAITGTFFLVLVAMLLPLATTSTAILSPARAYFTAFAIAYPRQSAEYWQSVGIAQTVSWLMLSLAAVMLPRCWQDKTVVEKIRIGLPRRMPRRSSAAELRRNQSRKKMLAINPALWLASRHSRARLFAWGTPMGLAAAGVFCVFVLGREFLPVFIGTAWIFNLIMKMRVAAQACHCQAEARRNNALEMLLATPLRVDEIIRGQNLAQLRMFLWPVLAMIAIEAIAVFCGLAATSGPSSQEAAQMAMAFLFFGGIYFVVLILDLLAVMWAGMWFGLTAKTETKAVTKTILLVLVLPYASFFFCYLGVIFIIGIPIFWIAWCSSKLRAEFRTLAAQRYAPPKSVSNWPPPATNLPTPPVIAYPSQ